jgi:hypothetical protein
MYKPYNKEAFTDYVNIKPKYKYLIHLDLIFTNIRFLYFVKHIEQLNSNLNESNKKRKKKLVDYNHKSNNYDN